MKAHTQLYKDTVCLFGRELDSKINYTLNGETIELGSEQLNSVTPHYKGGILKSVMRQLDIDSNVDIPVNTIVNYQFGVKTGEDLETGEAVYEYLNFGNYIVYSSEKQEDLNSYKIICYDKMLYSMVDYEGLEITFPITIRNYINAICNKLGLTFKNASGIFANYDKELTTDVFLDEDGNFLGYTYRDVLDQLAQVTASTICINEVDDELEIRYINDTNDTIDEEYLKDINVNFGEKFGAVNTIVLSRSAGADNIYYPEILPENPIEIKISDNQIMNGNNRDIFMPDIYNKLNGLEFYLNDYSSTGITYYNLCDRYNVVIGDKTYSCIMFNDEINVTQGLEELVYTDRPEESVTDYTKADKTDRRINETNLIVDKQNQVIQGLVTKVDEYMTDITLEKTVEGYPVEIEDAGNYNIVSNVISGKNEQETSTQGKNICPTYFSEWESGQYDGNGNKTDNTSRIRVKRLVSVQKNTTYYVDTNNSNYVFVIREYDSSKTFTQNLATITNGGRFTISSTGAYIGITIYSNTGVSIDYSGYQTLFSNDSLKPFICLNSETDKTYEPFIPNKPSPDYPSEIETLKGVTNLFKPTLQVNETNIVVSHGSIQLIDDTFRFTATGNDVYFGQVTGSGVVYDNTRGYLIDVSNIEIISYYISNILFTKNYITRYDENKISLGYTSLNTSKGTYTIPSGTKYISFRFGYQNSVADEVYETKVMIKEGSTIYNYVPYGTWLEEKTIGKNFVTLTQNGSGNGLTYDIENNEVLLNGTTGGSGNILYNKNKYFTLKAGTYTFSTRILSGTYTRNDKDLALYLRKVSDNSLIARDISGWNNYTVNSLVFTLLEDTDIYIQIFTNGSGYIVNNLKIGYQIEKGSISTPIYEPYKENTALIDMNKENLFDDELEMGGYANDGSSYNSNTRVRIKLPKTLEAGTYTYICSNTTKFILNKVGGGSEQVIDSNVGTFALNQTQDCLFTIQSTDLLNVVVKLFKSNNPTPYYEVLEQDTLTVKDNIATLDKQWGKIVLNGSETYNRSTAGGFARFSIAITNAVSTSGRTKVYSNYFKYSSNTNEVGIIFLSSGNIYIYPNSDITTVAEFQTWLSNNNVIVYYPLATQETIELPCEILELHEGYNYIDLNDDTTNMEVTYLTDSKFNSIYALRTEYKQTAEEASITSTRTDANEQAIRELSVGVDGVSISITDIQNSVSSQQSDINTLNNNVQNTDTALGNLQTALDNLNTKVSNMNYDFGTTELNINSTNDPNNTGISNKGLIVRNYNTIKTVANNKGLGTDDLIVTKTAQIGYLKFVKSVDENNEPVTDIHHLVSNIQDVSDLVGDN